MASVRIESKAFNDARLKILAKKLNISWHQVLGIMADLWRECTEEETYDLAPEAIDAIADIDGFHHAMIFSRLGKESKGKIYIVGTRGKTEWIANLRKNSAKGGLKKALKSLENKPDGSQMEARQEPGACPPTPTPTPTPALTKKETQLKVKPQKKINVLPHPLSDKDCLLIDQWLEHASTLLPAKKFERAKFETATTKIKKISKFNDDQMLVFFEWIRTDEFWKNNAISPNGLLQKSKSNPDLKKLDQVMTQFLRGYKKYESEKQMMEKLENGTLDWLAD